MLNISVVGLGMGLAFHLPAIVKHEKFKLVSVVDIDKEKLKDVSVEFGVKGYTDYLEMIDKDHPDMVVIASPTRFHASQAVEAMKRGIDVFLEKPMARSFSEAESIHKVQIETGRKLMVYQPHRTFNDTAVVKEIIDRGILGRIFMITRSMRTYLIRTSWQAYKENGGGTLNNHGSHYIDLLLYLSKGNPLNVSCEVQRVLTTGDADDCAKVLIKTDNDVLLDINMNLASAINTSNWEIYGSLGTAVMVEPETGDSFFRAKYRPADSKLKPQINYRCNQPVNDNAQPPWIVEDFKIDSNRYAVDIYDKCYEYFALGHKPFVPVEETLKVMEVLDRCHLQGESI